MVDDASTRLIDPICTGGLKLIEIRTCSSVNEKLVGEVGLQ